MHTSRVHTWDMFRADASTQRSPARETKQKDTVTSLVFCLRNQLCVVGATRHANRPSVNDILKEASEQKKRVEEELGQKERKGKRKEKKKEERRGCC